MVVNDTYMNSLLFNSNLMLLASSAISFQALWSFPRYFNPGMCFLANVYEVQILRLGLFGSFYGNRIPMIVMLAITFAALVFAIGRTVYRYRREKRAIEEMVERNEKLIK